MARYEVTDPKGNKYEIDAPDDATEAQILEYARGQGIQQQTPRDRMREVLGKVSSEFMSGMTQGGPMIGVPRALAAGIPPLMEAENEAITHGAYGFGGGVTDIAAQTGLPPQLAAGLGYVANVAAQAAPTFIAGRLASNLMEPAMKAGGRSLMQSATKPTIEQLRSGKAATAIDTMLEKGFNPTRGGVEKMKLQISALNAQIKNAIANSQETIDKPEVGKALLDTLNKFKMQVNPQADVDAIKTAWASFRNHPLLAGKTTIPVQLAQDLKTGTYQQLAKKYGQLGSADIEAQKGLARGLKEGIARKVPGIAALNAEESKLLTTLEVAERRALMDLNKNPGGLAWLTNNPTTFALFVADKSALFKSLAARMLYSGAQPIPKNIARTAMLSYQLATGQQSEP